MLLDRIRAHVALVSKGAFALGGFGGAAGLYGVYVLITQTHNRSGWFWVALGLGLLFLAQTRAVQTAIRQAEEARNSVQSVSQKLVHMEGGDSSLVLTGNVQSMQLPGAASDRGQKRRRWHHTHLSEAEGAALAGRGRDLADLIARFAGERGMRTPHHSFPPRGATPEEETAHANAESAQRDDHRNETHALFHQEYVGKLAVWIDEVEDAGFDIGAEDRNLRPPFMLAGPMPLEEISRSIYVQAARIERRRLPWWKRAGQRVRSFWPNKAPE
jgi:hypothetical protein